MRRLNKCIRRLLSLLQSGKQIQQASPTGQQPPLKTPEEWHTYWQMRGQPWRTEPEIDAKRQEELTQRRTIVPEIEKGIYPFKGMKLSRADVEWLLATHEDGLVDWSDESQQQRLGVDLRGANLRKADLSGLPLTRMIGGIKRSERLAMNKEQQRLAAVHLEGAKLVNAQLQGARLREAKLRGADLENAQLQMAFLVEAQLRKANLVGAQLQGADLRRADLDGATLDGVKLSDDECSDEKYGSARFAGISWGDIDLAVVAWDQMKELGDEQVAHEEKERGSERKIKDIETRVNEYKEAERANRQLAVVLRDQGLNEEADRFAYREKQLKRQVLQQKVLQKLEQMREKLRKLRKEHKGVVVGAFSDILLIFLCLLGLPSILLMKLEQIREDKFLKRFLKLPILVVFEAFFLLYFLFLFYVPFLALDLLFLSIFLVVMYSPLAILLLKFLLLMHANTWPIVPFEVTRVSYVTGNSSISPTLSAEPLRHKQAGTLNMRKSFSKVLNFVDLIGDLFDILLESIKHTYLAYLGNNKYFFSLFLDLLAGYGYRPARSLFCYLAILSGFALAYHSLGQLSLFPDAFVFSLMSFHGRGFFPNLSSETNLHDPLVVLAAIEAVVGLLIEFSFIATFTQRFLGK